MVRLVDVIGLHLHEEGRPPLQVEAELDLTGGIPLQLLHDQGIHFLSRFFAAKLVVKVVRQRLAGLVHCRHQGPVLVFLQFRLCVKAFLGSFVNTRNGHSVGRIRRLGLEPFQQSTVPVLKRDHLVSRPTEYQKQK